MIAERRRIVCALAAVALSAGLDANAQKHLHGKGGPVAGLPAAAAISLEKGHGIGLPGRGMPGLKGSPGHGGAMPETSNRGGSQGAAPGKEAPGLGDPMPETSNRGGSHGAAPGKDAPGRDGPMPEKASSGGSGGQARGKEESDAPGENVQVSAGNAENVARGRRQLHEIPTCR